jgi:5-methylcytosine-specific restriction endonuclease McrA
MQRVLVVDKNREPLMPCHPARARHLLKDGKAAVLRRYPFTIILKEREDGAIQPVTVKIDPGSKTTGVAVLGDFKRGKRVIWAAELTHHGQQIRDALLSRRQSRRARRRRKTRYRQARFLNRRKAKGWLPPSLRSRVNNIGTWLQRLKTFAPVTHLAMQKLQNPEISGIEYQQGELQGYEVREYLLQKWGHKCAYCGAMYVPLQVEHIRPKFRGGSNRVSNLTLSCKSCNEKKGTLTAAEFGYPEVESQAKVPLKDAAAVNSTRWALYEQLQRTGLLLEIGTGARTKFNRIRQDYPKTHWLDAACVGESGATVFVHKAMQPLLITAQGRQSRLMCRVDTYGFPRTRAKQKRVQFDFQTGDIVKAVVPKGKAHGTHVGRVAVRSRKSFRLNGYDINPDYLRCLQRADGYSYTCEKQD